MPRNAGTADDHVVDFPRPQKGGNSQHLLVTMLGEFWRHTDRWLPARAIKHLAAELGVSASAAATALSRLTSRGVLEHSGGGRSSAYRFTTNARFRLEAGYEQFSTFGDPSRQWDRRWTATAFTVPETSRDIREAFRNRLRWLGFAPLYGALWVSPHDRVAEVEASCKGFDLTDFMVFRMDEQERRGRFPGDAWVLSEAPERYLEFIEAYQGYLDGAKVGTLTGAQAFALRTRVMDEWRAFPWDDPDLPVEMLPEHWPLATARSVFIQLHRSLGQATQEYLTHTLTELCPDALPGIRLDSLATD